MKGVISLPTCPSNLTVWDDVDDKSKVKKFYFEKEYIGNIAGVRNAIDRERVRRGMSKWTWTVLVDGVTLIKSVIIEELYKALEDIYKSPGVCTTYLAPTSGNTYLTLCDIEAITPNVNTLKMSHMNLMRTRINDLEDDCMSHNTSYNTTYNTGYCTTNYSNYSDYSNYSANYPSNYPTNYPSNYPTNYPTYKSSNNPTYNTTYNTSYLLGVKTADYPAYQTAYRTTNNWSDYARMGDCDMN